MTEPSVEVDAVARAEAEAAAAERTARDPNQTWVTMHHPELEGDPRSVVTAEAFNMLWASRGWQRLTDEQALQSETLGRTVSDSSPLLPGENDALRAAQGLDPEPTPVDPVTMDEDDTTATAAATRKTKSTPAEVKE